MKRVQSLRQLFPSLEWPAPVLADAFTSTSLAEPIPPGLMRTIDKFALRLADLVDDNDDETLVVGVDDLEENAPDDVVNAIRAAVARVLNDERIARSQARRERVERKLSERCSFHLLRPMVEGYFFGDPQALVRAGVVRTSRFDATRFDCESFEVVDAAFTSPSDVEAKDDWRRGGARRATHPKRYLKFLTSDARGVELLREPLRSGCASRAELAVGDGK